MTKEEEIHANVAVETLQRAWEQMAQMRVESEKRAQLAQARVKELEEKYEPKPTTDPAAP